jgi:hypothetical protein
MPEKTIAFALASKSVVVENIKSKYATESRPQE